MSLNLDIERVALLKEALPGTFPSALYLLLYLLQHRGQVMTYQRISEAQRQMRGGGEGTTYGAIQTAVKHARKAIGAAGWPVRRHMIWDTRG